MFLAIAAVAVLGAFWKEILLFFALLFIIINIGPILAWPFKTFENVVGQTRLIERSFTPDSGGFRVYIWNRSDAIMRRVKVDCPTGDSEISTREIGPGEVFDEYIPSYHYTYGKCELKWDFIKPRGQYR